jgi:flagellar biosynthetic protein FlhB
MSEAGAGEKSFAPTQKRKDDAVKKGDTLRSKELATAVAILVGGMWLFLAGSDLIDAVEQFARSAFSFDRGSFESFTPRAVLMAALIALLPPIIFLGLTVIIATVASQLIFGDGRFVASNAQPKASRINPASGFKRMFGSQGMIELAKSVLKVGLLGSIAAWWGLRNVPQLLALGQGELATQLTASWDAAVTLVMLLALGLAVIAMIDWPVQFIRRLNRLKMTHQEVRDENKQTEGSPQLRAAQRQRQREMARGGVSQAVKDAQFVLTNPSHFSVALAYDPALAPAPVVLAKGTGEKALAMRELASEFGVPVLEYPMLARSVYFTTRENQVIREELYIAIAALVAFVFSVKRGEHPPRPHVDVPLTMRFDTEGQVEAPKAAL